MHPLNKYRIIVLESECLFVFYQIGLEFYPGENVQLNKDTWDLVALRSGRFTITTETLSPYPDSPLYSVVKEEKRVLRRPFVHVIAPPVEPVFKLRRSL